MYSCQYLQGAYISGNPGVYIQDHGGQAIYMSEGQFFLTAKTIGKLEGPWVADDGEIITSDLSLKNSIESLSEQYSELFDSLRPVRFKYNFGTSGRYHTGFIAQDVRDGIEKTGLTTNDAAMYVEYKIKNVESCGIRYSEITALTVNEIQKLKKRVKELEEVIKELKKNL